MSGAHAKEPEKKQPKKIDKKTWIAVAVVLVLCIGFGSRSKANEPKTTEAPAATEQVQVQETPAPTPWRENPLDAINLDPDQRIALYDELDAAFLEMLTGPGANASAEEVERLEDSIVNETATKYGITTEEADMIYTYGGIGYLYDINPDDIKVHFGETRFVNIAGTTLIIQAKIEPSYNNEATINQNFINVQYLVEKYGCDKFSTISYFAVADMTDGSVQKVISFDVDKPTIKLIAEGNLIGGMIRDYAKDLWILPSLLK